MREPRHRGLTGELADEVLRVLGASDDVTTPDAYLIAYSGGLDSTVLLHVVHELRARLGGPALRAVHVHHGLQAQADEWAAHCARTCAALGVDYSCERVRVDSDSGEGIEAAARHARRASLTRCLRPGESLLTAHHADDQLETVLMALLRGSGVEGLAGMAERSPFGGGWQLRPFLRCARHVLESYAAAHGLGGVDDPSNRDGRYARSFVRHELVPRLLERWPGARATVSRSAGLCAGASSLTHALAMLDLEEIAVGDSLSVSGLAALEPERARNAVRHWLRDRGWPLPAQARLGEGLANLLGAGRCANPVLRWGGVELRRYRDRLYVMSALSPAPAGWRRACRVGEELTLPAGLGSWRIVAGGGPGPELGDLSGDRLSVRFRAGGERIELPGRQVRHTLKHLFQDAAVFPWMRARIPLLFCGDRLAAVGDLWVANEAVRGGGWHVEWRDHPSLAVPRPSPG